MTSPPPGWPPPGYPYDPNQPYPGWPPPPRRSGGEIFGAVVVGVFLYFGINLVVGFMVVAGLAQAVSSVAAVVTGAIVLALIAFGGGGVLVMLRNPWARGIGMGLMIGWAITSIVTVGFCTGLNPTLYGSAG
ncbi:hypothetical protein LTS72_03565 [Mycobacterium ostraviense]|nr:hypothetical protein [Mycobacterium ostraviense]UGT92503.1 hypothetical protein LTS72_03565 [Mycobacterium ostraviense]